MSDGFFIDKHRQREKSSIAARATWDAVELQLTLDVALGKPDDLTHYQDCIDGARIEGVRMTPGERAHARALSRNPR